MARRVRLSVLQHAPAPLDAEAAVNRIDAAAASAVTAGSALLVTPECSVTGYDLTPDEAARVAIDPDGDVARALADVARRRGIAIAWGAIARGAGAAAEARTGAGPANAGLRNLVRVVGADGTTLVDCCKTHLWGALDDALFAAADAFAPVVEVAGTKLGVLICYDVEFPESVRALALAGAELVIVPTALMRPFSFVPECVVPVRAYENRLFLAYANYCGSERGTTYEGRSCIVAPDGEVLARAPADAPALLHADIDPARLDGARADLPYLADRRPTLYRSLSRP